MPTKKPVVNAIFTPELKENFEKLCEIEHRSMSAMIAYLAQQAVEAAKREGKLGSDRPSKGKKL